MADLQTQAKTLTEILKLMRPVHWVKNVSIFAALIFSGSLLDRDLVWLLFFAFISFNFAASGTYVFNDILDAKRDRLHPIKKNRPIAKGTVPVPLAFLISAGLFFSSLTLAFGISNIFFFLLIGYIIMQIAYSTFLKNIYVIDIIIIAAGFVIRVYSGAFIINAHLSVWFLLCVISTALFLASGKRRAELGAVERPGETRKSLKKYSKELLNSYVTMFGNAAWMSWALFTFNEPYRPPEHLWLFLAEISKTTTINKLLMITIPITIFGIMRYENLIFEEKSEAPEKLLLTDWALVLSVGLWVLLVISIIYGFHI